VVLNNRNLDAITEFVTTFYDDLFMNMLTSGQFKICIYNNCNQIFQRRRDEDDHDWELRELCNEKCGNLEYRMGYYNKNREKEKERRRNFWRKVESKPIKESHQKRPPLKINHYFTNTTGII
jgi:hypothetical protein